MDSVLTSIKKMLGIDEEYTHFDIDITIHINTALMVLNQLGISLSKNFITDKTDVWTDLIGSADDIEAVKSYIYFKVRLMFDPPGTSFAIEAIERQLSELTFRLNIQGEGLT
jgi:hypothetical protein